jgi:hypothetical protein
MLPPGYREVLVTDTSTAERWEATFQRLGVDVEVVETTGEDVKRGEWQIGASERDEARARALVDAVAQGRTQLPGEPVLRSPGFRALAVVAVLAALVLGALLLFWARGRP